MILILSKDKEFSQALAAHAARQLDIDCVAADRAEAQQEAQATLVAYDNTLEYNGNKPSLRLAKPLSLAAFAASARQLASRPPDEGRKMGRSLVFYPRRRQIAHLAGGRAADLTDKETMLLEALQSAGHKGMTKDALLKKIWGFEAELNTHTLETHIYRLRGKIKELCGEELIAATDGGYRLEET